MRAIISGFLLAVGIVLVILGINAANSIGSDLSQTFRGTPTDRATLLILCGVGSTVAGLIGMFLSFRPRPRG